MASKKDRKPRIVIETPRQVAAFEVWYASGKSFEKTWKNLNNQTPPVQVSLASLYRYAEKFGWKERALERDKDVADKIRAEAIANQEAFLRRQIASGRLLQQKGLTYLNDDKIDPTDPTKGKGGIKNEFAALQAVKLGLDLEKVGMNIPDHTIGIASSNGGVIIRVIREDKPKDSKASDDSKGEG